MIQKFSDYDSIQIYEGGLNVEPGGYELAILGAKVEDFPNCSILKIMFDIINHEQYTKIFSEKYKQVKAQDANAKWPNAGTFDVFIPKDDGTENDSYTKQSFKRFVTSVEKSNNGYTWNWDEKSLKGKKFGGVFGREEFKTKNGDYKFAVKCRFPRSIESIISGNFTIPDDKLCKEHTKNDVGPYTASLTDMGAAYAEIPDDYETLLDDGDTPF